MNGDIDITNLKVSYDLGWATLSNSTSLVRYDGKNKNDVSFVFAQPYFQEKSTNDDVLVNELRLSSQLDGALQFVAGLYYEDIDSEDNGPIVWSGDPALNPLAPGVAFIDQDIRINTEQKAIFGELTYAVSDSISATLGGRYFDYKQGHQQHNVLNGTIVLVDSKSDKNEDGTNLKFNIAYTPSDEVMIYGQYSEGYRLGKARAKPNAGCDTDNDGILDDVGFSAPDGIESDSSNNFELGAKTSLLNSRVTVNVALYRINWQDMPISVGLPSCGTSVVLNGGESKSEGIELELQAAVSDKLRASLNASYGEAVLTEDAENLGEKGDNLPGSADYNISLGLEYSFAIGDYDAFVRGDYSYIGEYYSNLAETGTASGGFGQVDLKTGIVVDRFEVDIFVKNLTDEDGFTWVEALLGDVIGTSRAYRVRPRTLGLNIAYRF